VIKFVVDRYVLAQQKIMGVGGRGQALGFGLLGVCVSLSQRGHDAQSEHPEYLLRRGVWAGIPLAPAACD
jgi:hypothetical protein